MLKRNKDSVAFWDAVNKASVKVNAWPEWKKNVRVTIYSDRFLKEGE